MIETDDFEIWNLSDAGTARNGALDIFNIVGRVKQPETVRELRYRLNNRPSMPVYFNRTAKRDGRLQRSGDFNIDTIRSADLQAENHLDLTVARTGGKESTQTVGFSCRLIETGETCFALNLDGIAAAEEIGQIVDGRWSVSRDEAGRPCLEVEPAHAAYDRIIAFGSRKWTTDYEIFARLSVTDLRGLHNVGLLFKLNPHLAGDGTSLPSQWSSGLGYYRSYAPGAGLSIRFGVDVTVDDRGQQHGNYVLKHTPFRPLRRLSTRLMKKARLSKHVSELSLHRDYCFRMRVTGSAYVLSVWPADRREPAPQLVVENPVDRLPRGCVGILAHRAAVRLYEFEVCPA